MTTEKSARSYTARLVCNTEEANTLKESHANWQKIYAVAMDNILTLGGAYFPKGENAPPPSGEYAESLKDIPDGYDSALKIAVTFLNWFVPEKETAFNRDYKVSWSTAIERFKTYWTQARLGKINDFVLENLSNFNFVTGVSLIDRRAKFIDQKVKPTHVQKYFFEELKYQGYQNQNSKLWRSIISKCFGEGTKNNPQWDQPLVEKLFERIRDENDETLLTPSDLRGFIFEHNLSNIREGITGKPPAYLNAINNDNPILIKRFRKQLLERMEKYGIKLKAIPDEFRKMIVGRIEDLNLFPFSGNNEFFSIGYAQAWRNSCSTRSNAVKRIMDLLVYATSNSKLQNKYVDDLFEFCKEQQTACQIDNYRIRKNQDAGLEDFLQNVNSSQEEALEYVANKLESRMLRNSNRVLLEFIYKRGYKADDFNDLKNAVQWHWQDEKIKTGYLGYIHDVYSNPMHPEFGESQLRSSFFMKEGIPTVRMKLIPNSGICIKEFAVRSRRIENELLDCIWKPKALTKTQIKNGEKPQHDELVVEYNNTLCIPRNTKHHNPTEQQVRFYNDLMDKDIGFKLMPVVRSHGSTTPNWQISFSVPIEYNPVETKDSKVLGIDLGWREIAAYAVVDGDDYKTSGFLRHKENLFEDNSSASKELCELWQEVHNAYPLVKDGKIVEKTLAQSPKFTKTVEEIARCVKRGCENIDSNLFNRVDRLLDFVSPHYRNRNSGTYVRNQGKLSFNRFDMLSSLIQMVSRIIKVADATEYVNVHTRLQDKLCNIRLERARVISRLILQKAVEENVSVIAVEDLDIRSNSSSSRFANRRNIGWYTRRIISSLESEAPMHGIVVKQIDKRGTSHRDVNGTPIARLERINPMTIPERTPQGKWYSSINSFSRNLSMYLRGGKSDTDQIYKKAVEDFMGNCSFESMIDIFRKNNVDCVYVPKRGGEYAHSKILGIIHSDILASHNIAIRAIERLNKAKIPPTARIPKCA